MRGWLRRVSVVAAAGLVAGLLTSVLVAAPASAAVDGGCNTLGGTDGAGTCFVNGTVAVSGTITVGENLELQASAHLDATASGVILNVTGNMQMDAGSIFEADDDSPPLAPNDSANNITLHVTGNLGLAAGSRLSADNNLQGGTGGQLNVTVDG